MARKILTRDQAETAKKRAASFLRNILETRQVAYLSFRHVRRLADPSPATRTDQPPVAAFSTHPQLQGLGVLIDLVLEAAEAS